MTIAPKGSISESIQSPLFKYREDLRNMSLRIDSFELPGKSLSTKEVKHYGPFKKIPYAMTYEDLQVNILLSQNMIERNIISDWMDYIYNYNSSKLRYFDDYVTEILVTTLNNQNEKIHIVKFIDAYPIGIGEISYSYSNAESSTIPITFAYRKWIEIPVNLTSSNDNVKIFRDGNIISKTAPIKDETGNIVRMNAQREQ
jgi:hypothetical protein